jgi:hypothetical protein
MSSVVTAQSSIFKTVLPYSRAEAMPKLEERSPPSHFKQEEEQERGRRRSQSDEKDAEGEELDGPMDGEVDGNQANSSNSEGPARKRRRSRKGLDKKFECPHDGCGKSYSRAEHLSVVQCLSM